MQLDQLNLKPEEVKAIRAALPTMAVAAKLELVEMSQRFLLAICFECTQDLQKSRDGKLRLLTPLQVIWVVIKICLLQLNQKALQNQARHHMQN